MSRLDLHVAVVKKMLSDIHKRQQLTCSSCLVDHQYDILKKQIVTNLAKICALRHIETDCRTQYIANQ